MYNWGKRGIGEIEKQCNFMIFNKLQLKSVEFPQFPNLP